MSLLLLLPMNLTGTTPLFVDRITDRGVLSFMYSIEFQEDDPLRDPDSQLNLLGFWTSGLIQILQQSGESPWQLTVRILDRVFEDAFDVGALVTPIYLPIFPSPPLTERIEKDMVLKANLRSVLEFMRNPNEVEAPTFTISSEETTAYRNWLSSLLSGGGN